MSDVAGPDGGLSPDEVIAAPPAAPPSPVPLPVLPRKLKKKRVCRINVSARMVKARVKKCLELCGGPEGFINVILQFLHANEWCVNTLINRMEEEGLLDNIKGPVSLQLPQGHLLPPTQVSTHRLLHPAAPLHPRCSPTNPLLGRRNDPADKVIEDRL